MDQIIVPATPTSAQVQAALRQLIGYAGTAAAALGLAGVAGPLNVALSFVGPASVLVVFVWGQLYTRSQAKKLAVLAGDPRIPESVATTK